MAVITNGRVRIEVPDEKAEHYALFMGYRIVRDTAAGAEVEEAPKPRRGRPRKAT